MLSEANVTLTPRDGGEMVGRSYICTNICTSVVSGAKQRVACYLSCLDGCNTCGMHAQFSHVPSCASAAATTTTKTTAVHVPVVCDIGRL